MKHRNTFKPTTVLLFLLSGLLLAVGCLKDGIPKGDTQYPLVIVPSATEISAGDSVTFDVLLLDELVSADLFINDNKIAGNGYRFANDGVYDVYASMAGAKNSDTIEILVGDFSDRQKLELKVSGIMSNPISGVEEYIFSVTAGDTSVTDARIYVDNEPIPEYSHRFNPRQEPYRVFARKNGYLNSDTMQITIAPKRFKLFIRASSTEITKGETVTFETGYVNIEPILEDADIYINETKITGKTYTFNQEGTYTAIARKENFDDSDPVTINVGSEPPSGVYISGFEGTGSSAQAKLWQGSASRSTTLGNGYSTGIYNFHGGIYVSGYTVNSNDDPTGAKYWEMWENQIDEIALTSGNAVANSVMIEPGDGGAYVSGSSGNRAAYWAWEEITMLDVPPDVTSVANDLYYDDRYGEYAVGNIIAGGKSQATIWARDDRWSLSGKESYANAIRTFGNEGDYYAVGGVVESGRLKAAYWRDDGEHTLASTGALFSVANSVALRNSTPYIAGNFQDGTERRYAVIWLNNTMHKLSKDTEMAGANSIAVDTDGTIYVAGWTSSSPSANRVATYWVVNNSGTVTQTVKLTDGTKHAEATGITP